MPTAYSGRLTLTLFILLGALICIFPRPQNIFRHDLSFTEKSNLKPGIDMVGGVSLRYKIKKPDEKTSQLQSNLAEQVMEALKKRVDPDGVRNLIWRPIGEDELEIQMPVTAKAADIPIIRANYTNAQEQLEATNVRQSQVLNALTVSTGADRAARLADLAKGDPTRIELFNKLAGYADQLAKARETKNAQVLDEIGQAYDEARAKIEDDNLSARDLEADLEAAVKDPAAATKVADLKKQYASFPKRMDAIAAFETAYKAYSGVKGSLDDATDLKRLLKGSGVLEFHILADRQSGDPAIIAMYDRMRAGGKGPAPQAGDELRWYLVDRVEEFDKPGQARESVEWNDKHYVLSWIKADASMDHRPGTPPWALANAYPMTREGGEKVVGFTFNADGGKLFGDLTDRWYNISKQTGRPSRLAIVLDDKIISAPNLQSAITGGTGEITGGGAGGFSDADFTYLIQTLSAGSLPAQLNDEPISEQRIGSTLGADNLRKGLIACAVGLVVVGIFLIGYYYIAGVVAFFAVCMNLAIILGVMAALNATFTLPSIAGIVLTVGTAVDANVLIFERLREEQHRGMPLRMALSNSYGRAWTAIFDSNMTSLITSVFLYVKGTEEVKGFGLTLIIGIVASLFTALFVTKTIFGLMIDRWGVKNLSSFPQTFPAWDRLLKPNIDWMGLAWVFYTFSIIAVTAGLILFSIRYHQGKVLDIEFASGTSVEFELTHPMSIEDVRTKIGDKNPDLPAPSVVSVGTDSLAYEVVTPNVETAKVRDAVIGAMGADLRVVRPSKFDAVDQSLDAAMISKVVIPLGDDVNKSWQAAGDIGPAPEQLPDYGGGVAIRLTNLSPALSVKEIKDRIDRNKPQAAEEAEKFRNLLVVPPTGVSPDQPTTSAIVLLSNPVAPYSVEHDPDWRQQTAGPTWQLVKDAVNRPADLRKVNSFNASVAGDARNAAIIALVLSIAAIMVYIWFRFGNMTYATATVIALVHDTVFTIAAVGFAHYLANTWIGNFFQLEPFRVNLTLVAGILTIMGYSMIDTIVVFDRIRENRGKYGHLSRKVVNDAINQTLSRTLLTAGTTTVTVAFMYFMGGAGIHGFTFVLLIGILVGSYSSIAIASPLLLLGKDVDRRAELPGRIAPAQAA
jgi:SecD/SecF fusion protein